MKLNINTDEQKELLEAYRALDGQDTIVEGEVPRVVRVSYKLGGPARRVIAKNVNALRAPLATHEEAYSALFKEIWPNSDPTSTIKKSEDPMNFTRFAIEVKKLGEEKDEVELLPLPATLLWANGQDFPGDALATLDRHGLIEEKDGP